MKGLRLAVLLGAVGCAGDAQDTADAAPDSDAASQTRIVVSRTSADPGLPFTFHATGAGTDRVGDVSILGGFGTVVMHGMALDAFVYEYQPWPDAGYDLFQALLVDDDRWYVLWFYCVGDQLEFIYSEGTDGTALDFEPASGTCTFSETPFSPQVQLPAVDMPYPDLERGFTLAGAQLAYDADGPGTVVLDGREMVLIPFESVDCSACGGAGWWELHALLYEPDRQRACFGIFYMAPGAPDRVDLTYSITLPDLVDPAGFTAFDAVWSTP